MKARRTAPLASLSFLALIAGCRTHPDPSEQSEAPTHPVASAAASEPAKKVIVLPARELPATYVVVLLHGYGADASSFSHIGEALGGALPHAEFLVPDAFYPFEAGGSGRQWFGLHDITEETHAKRLAAAGEEVSRWIDAELLRRHLPADKLVIAGFSQGAMLTSWLAIHRSPRPAAAVMLSGRVSEPDPPKPASPIPMLVLHGARDQRIPVSVVEPGARVLEAWGLHVTTRVYPDLTHSIDDRELADVSEFLKGVLTSP